MKFIVDKKIYDTDKSELLATFTRGWRQESLLGTIYPIRETHLYKTEKGAWFLVSMSTEQIDVIDEEKAKEILMYKNYEKYAEMFGALEEA